MAGLTGLREVISTVSEGDLSGLELRVRQNSCDTQAARNHRELLLREVAYLESVLGYLPITEVEYHSEILGVGGELDILIDDGTNFMGVEIKSSDKYLGDAYNQAMRFYQVFGTEEDTKFIVISPKGHIPIRPEDLYGFAEENRKYSHNKHRLVPGLPPIEDIEYELAA